MSTINRWPFKVGTHLLLMVIADHGSRHFSDRKHIILHHSQASVHGSATQRLVARGGPVDGLAFFGAFEVSGGGGDRPTLMHRALFLGGEGG